MLAGTVPGYSNDDDSIRLDTVTGGDTATMRHVLVHCVIPYYVQRQMRFYTIHLPYPHPCLHTNPCILNPGRDAYVRIRV